ncbi:MAG: anhydro-N-acetylmuramic acid kinase [Actinomycetota bacterium]|nr:anhydro-N-acetylmuramic acid kinase [Actinomycetota bacterium]
MIVVAVTSGTSVDAIDVAAADLQIEGAAGVAGQVVLRPLGHLEQPWPAELREQLLAVLPPATTTAKQMCALDTLVGQAFASAAVTGIDELTDGAAQLVVCSGQTVFHWVDGDRCLGTLQLGQPAWIVEATGLPVVSDLRARDVAAGGHGAPLASTLDALWLAGPHDDRAGCRAALNLGGIANVTIVSGPSEPVRSWDTGPANCLLDAAAQRISGGTARCDVDGRLARAGSVRHDLLERLLAAPYFALPPPKSTGREMFDASFVDAALQGLEGVDDADLLATLTELCAVTVADALGPYDVREVVVSGGGTRNEALLAALRRRLGGVALVTSDDLGLPSSAKEAYLFALLGLLTWHQVPCVAPGTDGAGATGARARHVLGRISPGDRRLVLPDQIAPPQQLRVEAAS